MSDQRSLAEISQRVARINDAVKTKRYTVPAEDTEILKAYALVQAKKQKPDEALMQKLDVVIRQYEQHLFALGHH